MKSKLVLAFGVLLVFNFCFIGCEADTDPSVNPNSLIITGVVGNDIPVPSTYNFIRIRLHSGTVTVNGNNISWSLNAVAGQDGLSLSDQTIKASLVVVENGSTSSSSPAWTESGEYFISISFVSSSGKDTIFWYTNGTTMTSMANVLKYNFANDMTTIEFSKFKKQPEM